MNKRIAIFMNDSLRRVSLPCPVENDLPRSSARLLDIFLWNYRLISETTSLAYLSGTLATDLILPVSRQDRGVNSSKYFCLKSAGQIE